MNVTDLIFLLPCIAYSLGCFVNIFVPNINDQLYKMYEQIA